MSESLPIKMLRLQILPDNKVYVDVQVDDQWRRVITTYHAGYTDHQISRGAMEVGSFGTSDVTEQYKSGDGDE